MKIEMGESLFFSWLRHIKHCQLVQKNWKVSKFWEWYQEDQVNKLHAKIEQHFLEKYDYHLFKQNSSANQILKQGECGLLGLAFNQEGTELYAVDVAFHEAGLNYGRRQVSVMKVIAKMARTALCLVNYINYQRARVIFASPKIGKNIMSDLEPCIKDLNEIFKSEGIDIECQVIANADFYQEILAPTVAESFEVADTSELFLRSYQMLRMFFELDFEQQSLSVKVDPKAALEGSNTQDATLSHE